MLRRGRQEPPPDALPATGDSARVEPRGPRVSEAAYAELYVAILGTIDGWIQKNGLSAIPPNIVLQHLATSLDIHQRVRDEQQRRECDQ